jgi:hypothetical protein
LKLGVDVSATTIATVLRRGGLGPAPRRVGPTWRQFLRLQAYGLLSSESRSHEQDGLNDLDRAPHQEAPARAGDDPPTTEGVGPLHDPSGRDGESASPVVAWPRRTLTAVPSGARARDGPAMAA